MSDIVYSIENLLIQSGKTSILTIENLNFKAQQIHLIAGPNGSGKTTLMKAMNNLIRVKKDCIFYKGKDITINNEIVRNNSVYVHQNPYPLKGSVYYNISYGLKLRKISEEIIQTKVDEILYMLNIKDLKNKTAYTLSAGELQKCALARAIVLDCEVFFFDEPVSSVDIKSVDCIKETMQYLVYERKKTVIYTTHQSLSTENLYDNIIRLDTGRIVK